MKKRKKKHSLGPLRNLLGCTQDDLANFLLVSRSAVSKAERATRNLPDFARPDYELLVNAASRALENSVDQSVIEAESKARATRYLQALKNTFILQLADMNTELLALKKQYQEYLRIESLLRSFEIPQSAALRTRQRAFEKIVRNAQERRRLKCDLEWQYHLEMKIAAKKRELGFIEERLKISS